MVDLATVPPGIDHQISVKFTDLRGFGLIAELPVNALKFSKVLNGVGPIEGYLNVEDEDVRKSPWLSATAPNLTGAFVDIDGSPMFGGRVTGRKYQMSMGRATLTGTDFNAYQAQRLQARDYTAYRDPEGNAWSSKAPVTSIAYWLLRQAYNQALSIPIGVALEGEEPDEEHWIAFSAPAAQQQTLSSMISQLAELGYLTGIDYASDVAYTPGGLIVPTTTLSYPRRGVSGPNPVVIDVSSALDLEYDEDGGEQADRIVGIAGATKDRSNSDVYPPAQALGYPLLEAQVSLPALAPTEGSSGPALEGFVGGALAMRAFPLTVPVVTLPLFGEPSIHEVDVGQDVLLKVPLIAGEQPYQNPRFPKGLLFRFRIVRIDVVVPDDGEPTMALTLNLPPSIAPVEPPETESSGGSGSEGEEKEREEQAEKEQEEKERQEEKEKEEKEEAEQREKEEAEEKEQREKEEQELKETEKEKEEREEREKSEGETRTKEEERERAEREKREAKEREEGGGSEKAREKAEKEEAKERKEREEKEKKKREEGEKKERKERKEREEAEKKEKTKKEEREEKEEEEKRHEEETPEEKEERAKKEGEEEKARKTKKEEEEKLTKLLGEGRIGAAFNVHEGTIGGVEIDCLKDESRTIGDTFVDAADATGIPSGTVEIVLTSEEDGDQHPTISLVGTNAVITAVGISGRAVNSSWTCKCYSD